MSENLHFIDGDPRLACTVDGEGPPVVFLHGIGGRRQNWNSQIDALRSNFTCIAWDARGYGDSQDHQGQLAFSDFADDLFRLVEHLEIERAHLVGLSMGARILLDFHPRYGERVATLTLCDCFYSFESALSPEKQKEFIELRERPLREGKTFADLAPKLIESLVSPSCSAEVREDLRQSIIALRTESYLKTLRASVSFDRGAELDNIEQPVQLIFGGDDRLTPPSIGREMQLKLADAELAVLDGAGHLSNLEKPALFNETLLKFLTPRSRLAAFSEAP
jgi:3-oxoadipate enol-lactonase